MHTMTLSQAADFATDLYGAGTLTSNPRETVRDLTAALAPWKVQVVATDEDCYGHESLNGAHMGETVYCDGSCRA